MQFCYKVSHFPGMTGANISFSNLNQSIPNIRCTAHGLQTETVGSPVDRNCPLVMLTHYDICPLAAHGQFSGQELPTYFQSHFNIWPWAAHWQLGLLYHIVASSVDGSNFDTEKAVGNGQLQHRFFTMPVNNDCTIVDIQCIIGR